MTRFLIASLCFIAPAQTFAVLFLIAPAETPEPPVYDVTAFGAVANDGLSDTAAVQAALKQHQRVAEPYTSRQASMMSTT